VAWSLREAPRGEEVGGTAAPSTEEATSQEGRLLLFDPGSTVRTNADGRAELPPDAGSALVSADGFRRTTIELPEPPPDEPLVVHLDRLEGPGRHVCADLPLGPVTVEARVAGGRFTLERAHQEPRLVLTVPATGAVEVVAEPSKRPLRSVRVTLRGEPGELSRRKRFSGEVPDGTLHLSFADVLPGRWEVFLDCKVAGDPLDDVDEQPVGEVEVLEGNRHKVHVQVP
jgi:hypothetical protein